MCSSDLIAQKAAEVAIGTQNDFVTQMVAEFEKRSNYMYERLSKMQGLGVIKPSGAFYSFIDVSDLYGKRYKGKAIESAADFAAMLLEDKQVAVVPCADFEAPTCIRLSYAISMESIEKGLDRIESFLSALED